MEERNIDTFRGGVVACRIAQKPGCHGNQAEKEDND